jgi:hypothetical protein
LVSEKPIDFSFADIEQTWERSPLNRDAVSRIVALAAARTSWEQEHLEAVYLTVARVADIVMHAAINPDPLTHAEVKECGDAFLHFITVSSAQMGRQHSAPPPPVEWMQAMRNWMLSASPPPTKRGAPAKDFDLFAYPLLLSLYRLISGAEPAATTGGPTERFLSAYLAEMRANLSGATFSNEGAERRVRGCFGEVTGDALRMKVRRMKDASVENDALLDFIWKQFVSAVAAPRVGDHEQTRH